MQTDKKLKGVRFISLREVDGGIGMKRELQLIHDIFKIEVTEVQLGERIEDVLDWNSFMIMQLMAEVWNRYQYDITVEEIGEIETLQDLAELLHNCRKS